MSIGRYNLWKDSGFNPCNSGLPEQSRRYMTGLPMCPEHSRRYMTGLPMDPEHSERYSCHDDDESCLHARVFMSVVSYNLWNDLG